MARIVVVSRSGDPELPAPGALPGDLFVAAPALEISASDIRARVARGASIRYLVPEGVREYARWWRGDLAEDDFRVSPLAANLSELGPLSVFSGTRDILNPDARALVRKARDCGVDVDYHERAGLLHAYPLTPTPEGRAARRIIVNTVRAARSAP